MAGTDESVDETGREVIRSRPRRVLQGVLSALGAVMLVILMYDFVGHRLLDGQRYCRYTFEAVDDFEGAGRTTIDVADTGSGCSGGVGSVCVVSRILAPDVRRDC